MPLPRATRWRRCAWIPSGSHALERGHGLEDRLLPREHLVVQLLLAERLGELPGQLLHEVLQAPHLLDLLELREHVVEVERLEEHALRDALRLVLVDLLLRLLDEADDVAHAEDAARDALGVEGLEALGLLARADELDRLAGDAT